MSLRRWRPGLVRIVVQVQKSHQIRPLLDGEAISQAHIHGDGRSIVRENAKANLLRSSTTCRGMQKVHERPPYPLMPRRRSDRYSEAGNLETFTPAAQHSVTEHGSAFRENVIQIPALPTQLLYNRFGECVGLEPLIISRGFQLSKKLEEGLYPHRV